LGVRRPVTDGNREWVSLDTVDFVSQLGRRTALGDWLMISSAMGYKKAFFETWFDQVLSGNCD